MTRGEIAMVAFIFLLIWVAQFLPRFGDWLGGMFFPIAPRAPKAPKDGRE
jgi:hypothetical protein